MSLAEHRLQAAERAELAGLLARAAEATGLPPPATVPLGRPDALRALGACSGRLRAALESASSPGGSGAAGVPGLVDLVLDAQALADRVRAGGAAEGHLLRLREALVLLRDATSTADLTERAVAASCHLGFDRAIVSRVQRAGGAERAAGELGVWVARAVHVDGDPQWAEQILRAGREHPQRLAGQLVEVDVVRHGRAVVVPDVGRLADVHRRIAEASGSRSYVTAPIVAAGEVVGLLHADRHFTGGSLGSADADALAAFGEALGLALARTTLLDRLAGRSEGARAAGLTAREIDVLRGMAAGETNGRIAARLVVTEGTVKTHVQHILRKLGAANRAEAVTRWLGSGPAD